MHVMEYLFQQLKMLFLKSCCWLMLFVKPDSMKALFTQMSRVQVICLWKLNLLVNSSLTVTQHLCVVEARGKFNQSILLTETMRLYAEIVI